MRLLNQTITTGLNYEIDIDGDIMIGTKIFQFSPKSHQFDFDCGKWVEIKPEGVNVFHDPGTKQFISNDWYNINTSGTYE